ncbi:hypothetical protein [Radicibacter daui]|uniref:hypothetical protein n=1 Tax=Radicibacter daui TaxID=3064829 RepID=UPI004046D602
MSDKKILSEEELDRVAEKEFLDEARDIINGLELVLQNCRIGSVEAEDAAATLRREASNLHLRARACRQATLSVLAQRFDDYAASLKTLVPAQIDDVQRYLDRIGAALDGDVVEVEKVRTIVRELPRSQGFDVKDVEVMEVEIMLVMPQRSAARIVERELVQCGYRVMKVLDEFEAIPMAVRVRPDLILVAGVLKEISGVDLLSALSAMPTTAAIPSAVLTSLAPNHPDLARLPLRCGLIRRGSHFADDLAQVLHRFDIT